MRMDCCTGERSLAIWLKCRYYTFWDKVNRKKCLRPLYNLHFRILCWRGEDDWEDIPGIWDEDNPLNPDKFLEKYQNQQDI